jgi:hypothetical protein
MQNRSAAYAERRRHSGVTASTTKLESFVRADWNVAVAIAGSDQATR